MKDYSLLLSSLTSCNVSGNIMHQVSHLEIRGYILLHVELIFFVSLQIWFNMMTDMNYRACSFLYIWIDLCTYGCYYRRAKYSCIWYFSKGNSMVVGLAKTEID